MTDHANFQHEIYLQGMAGNTPELPMTYEGLDAAAREKLPPRAHAHVAGGAGDEHTMDTNREAFRSGRFRPHHALTGQTAVADLDRRLLRHA